MIYWILGAAGFVAACWFALSMRMVSTAHHWSVIYFGEQTIFMIGGVVVTIFVDAVSVAAILLAASPLPGAFVTAFAIGCAVVFGLAGWQNGKGRPHSGVGY